MILDRHVQTRIAPSPMRLSPLLHRHPIVLAVVLVVIAWLGFAIGRWRISNNSNPGSDPGLVFRVSGDSMAPTLRDGDLCRVIRPGEGSATIDGTPRQLAVGDVVAVRWDDRDRIKRIAALGGDCVDQVDGRLMINGKRLDDIIATRGDGQLIVPATIPVRAESTDWRRTDGDPDWLVFHFRNPHQGDRPTPPIDDYPENVTVSRSLNPIDRLGVRITFHTQSLDDSQVTPIDVAFFDFAGDCLITQTRDRVALSRNAVVPRELAKKPPVIAERPIALYLPPEREISDRTIASIDVFREIEYRVAADTAHGIRYPVVLAEDEVFVVGDNHPVSIDSRQIGPINRDAVLGIAIKH